MSMLGRIDAHHHCWRYEPARFPWIDERCRVLARDFSAEEFATVIAEAGIDGAVIIQNHQTAGETAMLCDLARRHRWIRGVVGWFPLDAPEVGHVIDLALADQPKLCGARVILQGTEPGRFFENAAFHAGLEVLAKRGLTFDLLVNEPQLARTIALVDAHPELRFVLDHLGKPDVKAATPAEWRGRLRELARRPNVVGAKLSGLPMEADWGSWREADLRPYLDAALESFGPSRLLFGSDWPPCLVATGYARWVGAVADFIAPLSAAERLDIWGGTAVRAYRLRADSGGPGRGVTF